MTLPQPPGEPNPVEAPTYAQPTYPQPTYPQPAYAQPTYPPPGAGWNTASALPAPYGYPGYPRQQPARLSAPAVGWALLLAGVVAIVGSVSPWANLHFLGISRSIAGTDGDGSITLFFGALIAVMGLLIGLRQGRLWTSIVAVVLATLLVLIALIDLGNLSRLYGPASTLPDNVISVGFGIWLVLVAGLGALVAAIVAVARRTSPAPRH